MTQYRLRKLRRGLPFVTKKDIAALLAAGLRVEFPLPKVLGSHSPKNPNYGAVRDLAARVVRGLEAGTMEEIAVRHGLNGDSLRCQVWRARQGQKGAA